jgi:hypothetical protein
MDHARHRLIARSGVVVVGEHIGVSSTDTVVSER